MRLSRWRFPADLLAVLEMQQQAQSEAARPKAAAPRRQSPPAPHPTRRAHLRYPRGRNSRTRRSRQPSAATPSPPKRKWRIENAAPISTMATKTTGAESSRYQCMPVPAGRKARFLQQRDEPRQLPEADRLGRSKALLDVLDRQVGRDSHLRRATAARVSPQRYFAVARRPASLRSQRRTSASVQLCSPSIAVRALMRW